MKRRIKRRGQAGFALFAVIILLAIVTAAVALSLDEAVSSIQSAGRIRTAEIIRAGLDLGLDAAMVELQGEDPTTLLDTDFDIFDGMNPLGTSEYPLTAFGGNGNFNYPPAGDYAGQYRVRVGLRPGQRTRAPEGEDVTTAYGQIVEVQISVDADETVAAGNPPAEERVAVGVLIPRQSSHSQ